MPKSKAIFVRRRWTERDARVAMDAVAASGLSIGAFAEREGIDRQRLYYWRHRLLAGKPSPAGPRTTFLEIRPQQLGEPVEIVLRSARVLRVPVSIDGETLLRLVDLLEQERGC